MKSPNKHISQKQGCPECSKSERTLSHEEHAADIMRVNPNIEVLGEIINSRTKVLCCCKVCSYEWDAVPYQLKDGHGCPKCGGTAKKTTQEFIHDAVAVHGDKYDYSKVEYVNAEAEVVIICPEHGEFSQTPHRHVSGRQGCPKCADRGFLSHEHGKLYLMVDDLEVPTIMKVGVSIDAEKRKGQVIRSAKKAGAVFSDLHVIKTWEGTTDDMQALEKAMHQALSQYKINFTEKFDGCQEFFYYRPEVFELVEEHLKKVSK